MLLALMLMVSCDDQYIIDNPQLKGDYSTYDRYKRRCEYRKRVLDNEDMQSNELHKQTEIMENEDGNK